MWMTRSLLWLTIDAHRSVMFLELYLIYHTVWNIALRFKIRTKKKKKIVTNCLISFETYYHPLTGNQNLYRVGINITFRLNRHSQVPEKMSRWSAIGRRLVRVLYRTRNLISRRPRNVNVVVWRNNNDKNNNIDNTRETRFLGPRAI